MSTSSRAGGCTFPEDPDQSCASVLPMWSAAVDPRVLSVRAMQPSGAHGRLFDGQSANVRMLQGPNCEHLAIDRDGETIRLDVIEGSIAAGPVILHFVLADDARLDAQIAAVCTFRSVVGECWSHSRLAGRLLALQAVDARDAGASLREIANMLLGPGDWPGDGEHRKSLVRRLVVTGDRMARAGPHAILADR